jgi:hypothetical protein
MIQTRYLMLMSCTPQVNMYSHSEVMLFYESFARKPSMRLTMEAELISLDTLLLRLTLHDGSFTTTYGWLLKALSSTYGWSLKTFSDL